MIKKIISIFTAVIFLVLFGTVYAENEYIKNGGFDDVTPEFSNMYIDGAAPFEGMFCANVSDGEPEKVPGGFLHRSHYMGNIELSEGKLYEVSMAVRSSEAPDSVPDMDISFEEYRNRITVAVYGIDSTWKKVSGLFMTGKNGSFEFDIALLAHSEETSLYIDSISIREVSGAPVSMKIEGARSLFVPDSGELRYTYRVVAVNEKGRSMPIVLGGTLFVNGDMPSGVTLGDDNKITVSADAEADTEFELCANPPSAFSGLASCAATIKLGKNYIENGDFSAYPSFYGYYAEKGSVRIEEKDNIRVAKIASEETENGVFESIISIDKTYPLKKDKMYVFHALVFSDDEYYSKETECSGNSFAENGSINIEIKNVSRNKTDISSVIELSDEGVYEIKLLFENADERPVYITNIRIFAEEYRPTSMAFIVPSYINIPENGEISLPINYAAKDQSGRIMSGESVSAQLDINSAFVSVNEKTLTVKAGATEGEYKIRAYCTSDKDVYDEQSFYIGTARVGDGGFEKYIPGHFFTTAQPSEIDFVGEFNGNKAKYGKKMCRLKLNGTVSALLADSVMKLEAGKAYVLNAYLAQNENTSPVTMSAVFYNINAQSPEDNIALMQREIKFSGSEIHAVFVPQKDITGRLMLGFTTYSYDGQEIAIDNVDVTDAVVSCDSVAISGYPYPEMLLSGKHGFYSNFDTAEYSTYKWLSSSSLDGVYIPIEGETQRTLSVTSDMVGSYIKFEVFPASLSGPVYGAAVSSPAVLISKRPEGGGNPIYSETKENQNDENDIRVDESLDLIKKKGLLGVVDIYSPSFDSPVSFVDIRNHWAKNDVDLMSAAGIINGNGNMLFEPDKPITRAEFCAFTIRVFSLAPLYYSGGYKDVGVWDWYAGVAETASKYNIAVGNGEGRFYPMAPITREEMCVMVMRALRLAGFNVSDSDITVFSDRDSISPWAVSFVGGAVKCGIISGRDDNRFAPQENASRAEAVAALRRMINYVINT